MSDLKAAKYLPRLALIQGLYYAMSAAWGLADIDSFMAVTGPKTDVWLVKTVALLLVATAAALLASAYLRNVTPPIATLALLSCLFLAGVDIYYVMTGTIHGIYLLDAIIEVSFAAAWIYGIAVILRR